LADFGSFRPHHQLRVKGRRGSVELDVALDLTAPWTVIFGPSGSGKSSVLRAACGLVPRVQVEFRRWDAAANQGAGEWLELQGPARSLPTSWRELAYAPQGTAIFPHLSVKKNIEFGWKSRGALGSKGKADRLFVDAAIDLFAMQPLLQRRPRELSGGERQGVGLARAFAVPNAKLVLLDEPFSGIGRSMRESLLPAMRARLASLGVPALSVTHDVEEAILLGAEVVRLEAGKVVARGPAKEVLADERVAMMRTLIADD
jgi:molybdate transport system ATP-binding protein